MILQYLENYLIEGTRFNFLKPDSFKYNGITQVGVGMVGDTAVCRDSSNITFTTDGSIYDLTLLTTIRYEPILTDTGEIAYTVENDYIIPFFTDEEGTKTKLTNDVMSSDIGKEVIKALKDEPALVSINREFDVSNNDPSKSDEKYATTGKGKPISKINMTYYLLKNVFIDNFTKIHMGILHPQIFTSDYSLFYKNLRYELESITFVAKPDYDGDTRRANLYRRWWKDMGSQIGNVVNIEEEETPEGISFEILFNNTIL